MRPLRNIVSISVLLLATGMAAARGQGSHPGVWMPPAEAVAKVDAAIAKAAKLPLKDAAYLLWMEKSELDKQVAPPKTEEERARQSTRSGEEITASLRYDHDNAADGSTFLRMKRAHPNVDDTDIKQAIVAAVKFNDDCFKHFSLEPTNYDKRADHAIAMAKQLNPGFLPSTYRQARWWVTFLMK